MAVRSSSTTFLILRTGSVRLALPLDVVVETMRPLPLTRLTGTPAFVLGVAVVRGEAVPVIDAAELTTPMREEPSVGREAIAVERYVLLRGGTHGDRRFVLAVAAVEGIATVADDIVRDLPVLAGAGGPIDALVAGDADLLVVLNAARIVSDAIWGRARASIDEARRGTAPESVS